MYMPNAANPNLSAFHTKSIQQIMEGGQPKNTCPLTVCDIMSGATTKERVTTETDAKGNITKKIITVHSDHQSSIELNYDRKGIPAPKVKVYEDDVEMMSTRLSEFVKIAEKHLTPLDMPQ